MKKTKGDEKEQRGDERGEKVSGANWEAWVPLQPVLWRHSSVIITRRRSWCVSVWRGGEHFLDGWSNMKISGSFNCSGLFEVHASVCHPNYALHHQSFKVQRYTMCRSKATKRQFFLGLRFKV